MSEWKKAPFGVAKESWLDLISNEYPDDDNYSWWGASVKWDGCIHLHIAGNVPFEKFGSEIKRDEQACDDYIHICNIDDMIERLQKLKEKAIEHFGENWGE